MGPREPDQEWANPSHCLGSDQAVYGDSNGEFLLRGDRSPQLVATIKESGSTI